MYERLNGTKKAARNNEVTIRRCSTVNLIETTGNQGILGIFYFSGKRYKPHAT